MNVYSRIRFSKRKEKLCVQTKGNKTSLSEENFSSFVLLIDPTDCFVALAFWSFVLLLNIYPTVCSFTGNLR